MSNTIHFGWEQGEQKEQAGFELITTLFIELRIRYLLVGDARLHSFPSVVPLKFAVDARPPQRRSFDRPKPCDRSVAVSSAARAPRPAIATG
jgi:hypothetical protein